MAKTTPIDALFEHIIAELEGALDLAVLADREARLIELAGHAQRLHHLAQAALILRGEDRSTTAPKPLD